MIEYTFPAYGRAIVIVIICAWASLLSHKCISNFNDGARSIFPELMEGRMSRTEFAITVTSMGLGWVLAGFSQWLGYGLISCYLTLIATDCLGAWAPNKWVAIIFGAVWGGICFLSTAGFDILLNSLPCNFINDLKNISYTTLPIFCMWPAIASAGQYGAKKGVVTGIIQTIIYITCTIVSKSNLGSSSFPLYPCTFAMLVGMAILSVYSISGKKEETIGISTEEENLFKNNIARIKSNWMYLCIQGGLNALGIATLSQVYQPAVLSATLQINNTTFFIITMVGVIISFVPLVVSTALATGVYQAVGLTTCMLVGSLFYGKLWFLAPVVGFAVEFIEIQLLYPLEKLTLNFPNISQTGDHIRNAMVSCINLSLTIGSFLAAYAIWNNVGVCIVGGFYTINEVTGQRLPKTAVGPIAVVIVGVLYNIMIFYNFIVF